MIEEKKLPALENLFIFFFPFLRAILVYDVLFPPISRILDAQPMFFCRAGLLSPKFARIFETAHVHEGRKIFY
jgi:hypothetical protein